MGGKYYLPGRVVPPEQQWEAIRAYIAQAGFAYRQDIVQLLHIRPKQCTLLLRRLVDAGALTQRGQKYALPEERAKRRNNLEENGRKARTPVRAFSCYNRVHKLLRYVRKANAANG